MNETLMVKHRKLALDERTRADAFQIGRTSEDPTLLVLMMVDEDEEVIAWARLSIADLKEMMTFHGGE